MQPLRLLEVKQSRLASYDLPFDFPAPPHPSRDACRTRVQPTPAPKSARLTPGCNCCLRFSDRHPVAGSMCLQDVTAEMHRGLSVVVGPTGCGKTTFLLGLVERCSPESKDGSVCVETTDSRVALCPDTPWIVNASARDNISLGCVAWLCNYGRKRSCVSHPRQFCVHCGARAIVV